MSYRLKTKIPQKGSDERILTPDLFEILVGENEDQILLYQRDFSFWNLKGKNEMGNYTLKNKITT